jgi:hypothetical protein
MSLTDAPADNGSKVKKPTGAPKGSKNHLKHGYYSLVKLIRNRSGALDKRTIMGKMVLETIRDLTASLGGDLSPQEQMLVDDVALDTLLLKSLNNIVATVQPLRKGKVHAAFQLRTQLIAQRREHLKLLGIKRVAKPILGIDAIKARYERQDEDNDKPEATGNGAADEG